MQKIIFTVLLCCVFTALSAQNTNSLPKDSVYSAFKQIISQIISEQNYTRVPVGDLDEKLDTKISKEVSSRFSSTLTLVGSALGILGLVFGGIIAGRQRDRFNRLSSELKDEVIADVKAEITKEVKLVFHENFKAELDKKTENINNLFNQMQEPLKEFRVVNLAQRVEMNTKLAKEDPLNQNTYNELKKLVAECETMQQDKHIPDLLDDMAYLAYRQRKTDEFEEIFSRHKGKHTIYETTFINTALSYVNNYHLTGAKIHFNKAIEYLNLSLLKIPNYGEAQALKLELLMMGISKSLNETEKQNLLEEARSVWYEVNEYNVSAYETKRRLDGDGREGKAFSKYVKLLREKFPEENAKLEQLAEEYEKKLPGMAKP